MLSLVNVGHPRIVCADTVSSYFTCNSVRIQSNGKSCESMLQTVKSCVISGVIVLHSALHVIGTFNILPNLFLSFSLSLYIFLFLYLCIYISYIYYLYSISSYIYVLHIFIFFLNLLATFQKPCPFVPKYFSIYFLRRIFTQDI